MDTLDINIYNYDLDEILNLFQLEYNYKKTDLKKCEETVIKLHPHNSNLEAKFFDFYNRAYKIVECLYDVRTKKLLLNSSYFPNPSDDTYFLNKIRDIPNFEKQEDNEILINKIYKDDKNDILYKALEQVQKNAESPDHRPIINDTTSDDKTYANTFENPVVSSSLNSIKRITVTKNLHLNSCFRTKYYTSNPCDFDYNFPSEVKNVVALRLASIEVPNSWYLFSHVKHNNRFSIEIKNNCECNKYIIVIPDGNYDCDTIAHYLNTTYFYESERKDDLKYLKFSINEFNFKSSFEIVRFEDDNENEDEYKSSLLFSLHFTDSNNDNIMNTLGWILGFRLGKYMEIDEAVQSEGIFDVGGDRYIYFCLNDYQYNKNESNIILFEDTSMDENVLAKIPMINGKLSLIVDENDGCSLTKTRRFNGPVNLKKVHIRLLDKFGEIVNLNKMDFSFTIELELLYERNKII